MSADQPWLDDREPEEPKSAWEQTKEFIAKQPRGPGWETTMALASGAAALPVSGLAGLVGGASSFLPGGSKGVNWQDRAADWTRATQNALTYEPKSDVAQWNLEKAGYLPQKLSEGADWVGGKVTDITGSPLLGTEANVALQAAPTAISTILRAAMPTGARAATLAARKEAQIAALNADNAATRSQAAGFSLPPSQVNPSFGNRLAEWYAGTGPVGEALGKKNQPLMQGKYRGDLEIAPGTSLDKAAYEAVKKQTDPHYNEVRKYGESAVDPEYSKALKDMEDPIKHAASKFPKRDKPPILDEIESLKISRLDGDAALTQIENLRNDARKAGSGLEPDAKLAAQYWKLAKILENELDRHLERAGAPREVIDNYRQARETRAKALTAAEHTKPSGEVSAKAAAKDLQAPFDLTGGMREVAELGANFPKATRLPSEIGSGSTGPWRTMVGGGLVRDYLVSDRFQKGLKPPSYGQTFGDRLVHGLTNPAIPLVGQELGQEAEARRRAFIELLMKDRQ